MIPDIYFFLIGIWALVILGFLIKDFTITMLSAIGLIVIGVYGIINGIANIDNLITYAFSVIHLFLGFYILINGSIEKMESD